MKYFGGPGLSKIISYPSKMSVSACLVDCYIFFMCCLGLGKLELCFLLPLSTSLRIFILNSDC